MKVVFAFYHNQPDYQSPEEWLEKIPRLKSLMEAMCSHCSVAYIQHLGFEAELTRSGVDYHFLFSAKRNKHRMPLRMNEAIKEMQPDVVIVSGLRYPLQIIQLRRALGKNVKIIGRHHADAPPTGFRKILQRYADQSIDAYLFTSFGNAKDWIDSGIIEDKQKILELLAASADFSRMDKQQARQDLGMSNGEILLYVGRLNANKDPLAVLKGFEEYIVAKPGPKLYMIYQEDDCLSEVQEFIGKNKNLPEAVILVGYIPYNELSVWYSAADFYISGSHSEGGSYALLEAMACGCIPIVTAIPAAVKVVDDGKYGIIFQPGDAKDLANKLFGLSVIDKQALSLAIENYFKRELSSEAIAAKLYEYCKGLLAK